MTGHIFIYGGIGREKGEISFDNVNEQISENKEAEELIVHIISPGGDVFEGEAIFNALKNSGKQITTQIEGTCASIATLIAAAGEKMIMNTTARFMIHNPKVQGFAQMADSRDLRHVANQLDKIKELLIDVYDKKTTLGKDKLWELYDNETWLTASEARTLGFVDEVVDAIKAVAKIDLTTFNEMEKFNQLATRFKNLLGLTKIRNEYTVTLADNRVVVIMAEAGEPLEGKQIILETGESLEDGDHALTTGEVISVAGGVITAVTAPVVEDKKDDEMENKIKELEAQLAEAKAQQQAAIEAKAESDKALATAKAETMKFQNRVTQIEKDFIALQEEASKTVGKPPVLTGPVIKNSKPADNYDPMGEMALNFYKNRNLIHED